MPSTTLLLAAGLAVSAAALTAPTWSAALKATDGSAVAGNARVEAVANGASHVTINLTGAPAGSVLPWHLHRGACGSKAGILGDVSDYPPIKVGSNGRGSAEASLPMQPGPTGTMAVQVHRSAMDLTPIACGALVADGRTMPAVPQDSAYRP